MFVKVKVDSSSKSNSRVLVTGTTGDYINLIAERFPNRAVFLTDSAERARTKEIAPPLSDEVVCDLAQPDKVLVALRTHLDKWGFDLSGITCFDCESMLLAAAIAEEFSLSYVSTDSVTACRNKFACKELWRKAGLSCPQTEIVYNAEEASAFLEKMGGAAVLKPIAGSGSQYVFLCSSPDDCRSAFNIMNSHMPALHEDSSKPLYSRERLNSLRDYVMEEFIHGVEYSCDFMLDGDRLEVIRLARKIPARDKTFGVTLAYVLPAALPSVISATRFHAMLRDAAEVLGVKRAVCMVDFIARDGELFMLEMTPRPGGDCLPPLILRSSGLDMFALALDFAEGVFPVLPPTDSWRTLAGLRLFADSPGVISEIESDGLLADSRVVEYCLKTAPGGRVVLPPEDYDSQLIGHVIFKPDNPGELEKECAAVAALHRVHIESVDDSAKIARALKEITPLLPEKELESYIEGVLHKKDIFLRAREQYGSPLYIIDEDALVARAREFTTAFAKELPDFRAYFAVKSNNHPLIGSVLAKLGFGLDVSSGLELDAALLTGCRDIIFSGPGKTVDELRLAVKNAERVTVLLDSFAELDRLQVAASARGVVMRAGVRLTTGESGIWRKFGIPLASLSEFFEIAEKYDNVQLRGIQFHISWNFNSSGYVRFLQSLGAQLAGLNEDRRSEIEFIDVGGGFWPERGEWLVETAVPSGALRNLISPKLPEPLRHFRSSSISIEKFAAEIGAAAREYIFPRLSCRICVEPGRWLCNDAMHILMSVIDKKTNDLVITDAGINAIGWDRFESDYFPVINLSRPACSEYPCMVMGSLCTPHDIWGYSCHGSGVENDDVLLVPSQGAYTYSLRQRFIKPLPSVVRVRGLDVNPVIEKV